MPAKKKDSWTYSGPRDQKKYQVEFELHAPPYMGNTAESVGEYLVRGLEDYDLHPESVTVTEV